MEPLNVTGLGTSRMASAPPSSVIIPLGARVLEHAVHVRVGQAHGVGEISLHEGPLAAAIGGQSPGPEAQQGLAREMVQATLGGAGADVDQPLAQRRLVHQRRPPRRLRDGGPLREVQDAPPAGQPLVTAREALPCEGCATLAQGARERARDGTGAP